MSKIKWSWKLRINRNTKRIKALEDRVFDLKEIYQGDENESKRLGKKIERNR